MRPLPYGSVLKVVECSFRGKKLSFALYIEKIQQTLLSKVVEAKCSGFNEDVGKDPTLQ